MICPKFWRDALLHGTCNVYFGIVYTPHILQNYKLFSTEHSLNLQVDLELSFTTQEDVRSLIESLMQYSWPVNKGQLTLPFLSMTYHDAMIQYGSDKPDTRFDMKVRNCGIFLFYIIFFNV